MAVAYPTSAYVVVTWIRPRCFLSRLGCQQRDPTLQLVAFTQQSVVSAIEYQYR